jgi:hypothetical protein
MTRADDERRRALTFLADNPDGCTRANMLAWGFSLSLTASLIRAGLATDEKPKQRGGRPLVARVRLTEVGRQALAGQEPSNF